jgi:dephospho-CoA kinase
MPETETLELRTDTVEQLIDLLEASSAGEAGQIMPRDRRRAVAGRLKRQISRPDAIALCGLPGAGKSYAADKLSTVYDAPVVSMGDAIRQSFKEEYGTVDDSEQLGEYAARWRGENPEGIPEKVTDIVDQRYSAGTETELFIIDGVRSVTDYEVLNGYFDNFHLLEVKTNFYARLSRIADRGREGEESFQAVDLAERDTRELLDLGFKELREGDYIDLEVKNGTGPDKLAIRLSSVVENNLSYDIENGEPLGTTYKLEEMRQRVSTGK